MWYKFMRTAATMRDRRNFLSPQVKNRKFDPKFDLKIESHDRNVE
jgi:hypothetical protein